MEPHLRQFALSALRAAEELIRSPDRSLNLRCLEDLAKKERKKPDGREEGKLGTAETKAEKRECRMCISTARLQLLTVIPKPFEQDAKSWCVS